MTMAIQPPLGPGGLRIHSTALLLFFHDVEDLHAPIVAAVDADPVGELGLVAPGALRDRHPRHAPVAAVVSLLPPRSSVLGDAHNARNCTPSEGRAQARLDACAPFALGLQSLQGIIPATTTGLSTKARIVIPKKGGGTTLGTPPRTRSSSSSPKAQTKFLRYGLAIDEGLIKEENAMETLWKRSSATRCTT